MPVPLLVWRQWIFWCQFSVFWQPKTKVCQRELVPDQHHHFVGLQWNKECITSDWERGGCEIKPYDCHFYTFLLLLCTMMHQGDYWGSQACEKANWFWGKFTFDHFWKTGTDMVRNAYAKYSSLHSLFMLLVRQKNAALPAVKTSRQGFILNNICVVHRVATFIYMKTLCIVTREGLSTIIRSSASLRPAVVCANTNTVAKGCRHPQSMCEPFVASLTPTTTIVLSYPHLQ